MKKMENSPPFNDRLRRVMTMGASVIDHGRCKGSYNPHPVNLFHHKSNWECRSMLEHCRGEYYDHLFISIAFEKQSYARECLELSDWKFLMPSFDLSAMILLRVTAWSALHAKERNFLPFHNCFKIVMAMRASVVDHIQCKGSRYCSYVSRAESVCGCGNTVGVNTMIFFSHPLV